ncbi:MAG: hypothetical protein AAGI10_00990 [Pseudomonadota bacterium]
MSVQSFETGRGIDPYGFATKTFRWIVFLLAAFYSVHMLVTSDYSEPMGPFRYLTFWALLLSFFCASRLLAFSEKRSILRWDPLIAAVAVINFMVVYLYWSLFFEDPNSVSSDGQLGVWWREYYLHLLGPVLMWIDAVFVNRPFRRFIPSAAVLLALALGYFAWIELVVGPLNDTPIGSVTTGLPYPFLNSMELAERTTFYAVNSGVALAILAGFFAIGWGVTRLAGDRV